MSNPVRLQAGMTYEESIPFINGNFDDAVQDVADFHLVLDNLKSFSLAPNVAPGAYSYNFINLATTYPTDQVAGIMPQYTLFVDPPDLTYPNFLSTSSDYAYPDGVQTTGGKRALIQLTHMFPIGGMDPSTPFLPVFDSATNKTYYDLTTFLIIIRNLDAVSHSYLVVPKFLLLAPPKSSQFR
jgi:hypothetical protein